MTKLPKIGNDISLSEQAYLVIKEAIINNKLKPREILSEEALAAELNISRTPVRAALKRLDYERLITLNPGRNAVVADISQEDIGKVFPIRIALEALAAKLAAQEITEEQLAELDEIIVNQEEAIKMDDYDLYIQKDYEFHTYIAKFSKNEMLYNFVLNINNHVMRFHILSQTLQSSSLMALNEHHDIMLALRKRDYSAAEALMRTHVENVAARINGAEKTQL